MVSSRVVESESIKLNSTSEKEESIKGKEENEWKFLPRGQWSLVICFLVFAVNLYIVFVSVFEKSLLDPISTSENATITPINDNFAISTFTVLALLVSALAFGYLIEKWTLPALLGMLIVGILIRNIPFLSALTVIPRWSVILRKTAFIVILLRGGLSLDASALARMKGACLRLALSPCTVEAVAVAITSHLLFGISIWFGLVLGFVLAAVSPAVVVPSMLEASQKGYGLAAGIPTLVIAASSLDDVYAITLFSLATTITFSTGASIWVTIIRAPLEVIAGVVLGVLFGGFLRYFPSRDVGDRVVIRFSLLLVIASALLFGCTHLGIDASGAIAVLVVAFVTGNQWQKEESVPEEHSLALLWGYVFQPLLFVLIGFELSFSMLTWKVVLLGLLTLSIGLIFRSIVAFCAVFRSGLNYREQVFVAVAWLPKATVQAALAPVALDLAISRGSDTEEIRSSTIIFAIAVMSILTTAPIGAFLIRILAPRLLSRGEEESSAEEKDLVNEDV